MLNPMNNVVDVTVDLFHFLKLTRNEEKRLIFNSCDTIVWEQVLKHVYDTSLYILIGKLIVVLKTDLILGISLLLITSIQQKWVKLKVNWYFYRNNIPVQCINYK